MEPRDEAEACELPAVRTSDRDAWALMRGVRTIAVVGLSRTPGKPSHDVPKYLQQHGYRVIPVNPSVRGETLLGERVYASLEEVPGPVDAVEIFRPAADVPPIVDQAIVRGVKLIWMQQGIVHNAAAERARAAGVAVVMDQCMYKVHRAFAPGG